jgi:hypothetical protein
MENYKIEDSRGRINVLMDDHDQVIYDFKNELIRFGAHFGVNTAKAEYGDQIEGLFGGPYPMDQYREAVGDYRAEQDIEPDVEDGVGLYDIKEIVVDALEEKLMISEDLVNMTLEDAVKYNCWYIQGWLKAMKIEDQFSDSEIEYEVKDYILFTVHNYIEHYMELEEDPMGFRDWTIVKGTYI